MIIGVCTIELSIPAFTLKEKRQIIKSVIARLRNKFNISVAEVDQLEAYQLGVIAAVAVSNDADYVHSLLTRVARWVDESRLDCELIDYHIELI
ncbi:MAG: DUF503 domain-containing protein [Anaerolineae bacterium]|nr:DUF503 domain-containing protein [Anaerolineae bacterium]